MKKYFILIITLFTVFISHAPTSANEPGIIINGSNTPLQNRAYILNDRTYVPMREIFEAIGADVLWDDTTKSATAILNNTTLNFKIGSNTVVKNGEVFWSDSQCKLIDEKTYIPIRIMLELLGFDITWNESNHNVEIYSPSTTPDNNTNNEYAEITPPTSGDNNEYELKVLELVNIERNKNGLGNLTMDSNLCHVARAHSKDMYQRNFLNHTNPDGLSPFDRMTNYGISFSAAAENIAAGQATPEAVVNAWMNSEGHRRNILNPNFKKIGIGYYNSGKNYVHYWTQCFTN